MITLGKAQIYSSYHGDGDMYSRLNQSREQVFEGNELGMISGFIQDLIIVKNGLASEQFIENLNKQLVSVCDGVETVDFIKSLAENNASH